MKSSYYDILDKYYGGFCGDGDHIEVEDEDKEISRGTVRKCSITCVTFDDLTGDEWTVCRTAIVSITHCIQQKNHISVDVNDLISFPPSDDKDISCLGVVLRQNAPYASVRVLTGPKMSEIVNVWLKKLHFVAKGFSIDLYNELDEEGMNISYNSLPECLNLNTADQFLSFTEIFNPLKTRAKMYTHPLFRRDMGNDKLKKWGKGVLHKTKVMANILSPPAVDPEFNVQSPQDQQPPSSSIHRSSPQRMFITASTSMSSSLEDCNDEDMLLLSPTVHTDADERNSFSLSSTLVRPKDRRLSEGNVERPSSQDVVEDSGKGKGKGNFLSKLFGTPKKSKNDVTVVRRNSGRERRNSGRMGMLADIGCTDAHLVAASLDEPSLRAGGHHDRSRRRNPQMPIHGSLSPGADQLYWSYSDDNLNSNSSDGNSDTEWTQCQSELITEAEDEGASLPQENESRVWLNVNSTAAAHAHTAYPRIFTSRWSASRPRSYVSPPPAQPASPVNSVISDHDSSDTELNTFTTEDVKPETEEFVSLDSADTINIADNTFDFDSFVPHTPIQVTSGFYEEVTKPTGTDVTRDLVDLSNFGISFSPPQLSLPPRLSLANSSPVLLDTTALSTPPAETTIPDDDSDLTEGFLSPVTVKRSRVLRMANGIGFRTIPPFRKRVVPLPPLPIATSRSLVETPPDTKQVRFFTNVICHEYKSY